MTVIKITDALGMDWFLPPSSIKHMICEPLPARVANVVTASSGCITIKKTLEEVKEMVKDYPEIKIVNSTGQPFSPSSFLEFKEELERLVEIMIEGEGHLLKEAMIYSGICSYASKIMSCKNYKLHKHETLLRVFPHLLSNYYCKEVYDLSDFYWRPWEWGERLKWLKKLIVDLEEGKCDEFLKDYYDEKSKDFS